MLAVQQRFAYNDIKSVTLEEADLEEKSVGQFLESPKFDVPNSGGLKWWIRVYPAGETAAHRDSMGVFLNVNQSVKANMRFLIEGSTIQKSGTREFPNPPVGWGFAEYASHDQLSALLFRKSKLTITCIVEFDITQRRDSSVPLNYQLFRHVPTDVDLVMGSDRVPAHNGFLSLISPAFNAMFSHDNVESRLKKVEITDFDITTVKSVVDYCYGRELQNPSVETAVNILRFCDKYFITAAIEELEKLPSLIPSVESFCHVIHYAYDCNKDELLADYCGFFKGNQDEINELPEFADLPPTLVVDLLKRAFDLKTNFDVLHHAYENDIEFVVDHLEASLVKSMSIDDFCPTVSYAWKCSRDNLKEVCAAFLNDNRDEVIYFDDFVNLPPETVCEVLKAGRALKVRNA